VPFQNTDCACLGDAVEAVPFQTWIYATSSREKTITTSVWPGWFQGAGGDYPLISISAAGTLPVFVQSIEHR
jgi:hypothetical protein